MQKNGTINVTAENIFPIIKKFLYSDHEIFLRELISNAVDATLKLKTLSTTGEYKGETDSKQIEIIANKDKKTLTVRDQGIGMTAEEVEKYINEVAFSGAEEFVKKYENEAKDAGIIGHFGLGFYSAFMVSKKVEIRTLSQTPGSQAVYWSCTGSPEFELKSIDDKTEAGTEIILHVDDESQEFLEEHRINELLNKYCKFLPIPIKFGEKEVTIKDEEGKDTDKKEKVDNIVNNPHPAWKKAPADLESDDYKNFYRELYPMQFEEPLFHIHLNIDHPFNLTGILYFPKLGNRPDIQKDKIQLYQNQVFVTDNVEGIVPEFLTLLRGVIDSPDIPLNVSRSYLQADAAVKKISSYISRKVADKLKSMFNNERETYEEKWNDIKIVIEYGMLSDEKFFDKAKDFYIFSNTEGEVSTIDDYLEKVKALQVNKDKKTVLLYTSSLEEHYSYITSAKDKGYDILVLDSPLTSHIIQSLETKNQDILFARVDSDHIDKLIEKEDQTQLSVLSDDEVNKVKEIIEKHINKETYTLSTQALASTDQPILITMPEFMRRMKEMSETGGGGFGMMGSLPDNYNLTVNTNHPLITKMLHEKDEAKQKEVVDHAIDLAMLSQNLLKGQRLSNFIKRSVEAIS